MSFRDTYRAPKGKVNLSDISPVPLKGICSREEAEALLAKNTQRIKELQYNLYAEGKHSILVVLQGMDTSGKDGTIRNVLGPINPQGCEITSFKKPSDEEMAHDYLWRIHKAVPARGMIGVFNRSHYEDVLIVRVRNLVPKSVWSKRYDHINQFERTLTDEGTVLVKCFLHIDKDEQKERLESRLEDPTKHWKFNVGDLDERKLWKDYVNAYEVALEKCDTQVAPWYVIPANKKWFRNLVVSSLILETLEELNPKTPAPEDDLSRVVVK